MKIAFVTDSGTGKSVGELAQAEIYSVPLQVSCDNKNYQDLEELGIDEIYALMKDGKMLSTSLPSLGKIEELFQGLKQQGYDMIFAVPICSGLSGTINAMEMIAQQQGIAFDYVDCHVTAVVQEYMIKLAKQLHEAGKSIEQIKDCLLYTSISTAGKEASGTGNMKFMMNGAITLGTMDGANVEIVEKVGYDHAEIFGLRADDVALVKHENTYDVWRKYNENANIQKVVNSFVDSTFSNDPKDFKQIYNELMFKNDEYLLLADFEAYSHAQKNIEERYRCLLYTSL